jgi:hypothetical protein
MDHTDNNVVSHVRICHKKTLEFLYGKANLLWENRSSNFFRLKSRETNSLMISKKGKMAYQLKKLKCSSNGEECFHVECHFVFRIGVSA